MLVLEATYEATLLSALHYSHIHNHQGGSRKVRHTTVGARWKETQDSLVSIFLSFSSKVYLTLVGGGVFGNPKEWIAKAIARAVVAVYHTPLEVGVFLGFVVSQSNRPFVRLSQKIFIVHHRSIDEDVKWLIDEAIVDALSGAPASAPQTTSSIGRICFSVI